MKRSRLQIFLVVALLALLGVLAVFQYVWLGQISEAERDRTARRLQTDTERFGEDFDREIQNAYTNLQVDEALWQEKDWARFNERYDFWRTKTAYPNLIADFFYLENKPDGAAWRYDAERREFIAAGWTDELLKIRENSSDLRKFKPVDDERFVLVATIFKMERTPERIYIRQTKNEPPLRIPSAVDVERTIELPERRGFFVIKLDKNTLTEQILPDLAKKHFPEGDYHLSVVKKSGEPVFRTGAVAAADASVGLFEVSLDNFIFLPNREILPRVSKREAGSVVFDQIRETRSLTNMETESLTTVAPSEKKAVGRLQFKMESRENPRSVVKTAELTKTGTWTLNVQHTAGSVDKFISRTRNRNLGISFGILSLLAVSIVLIFVSAYRARILAQRQVDFVSSVSHEFRTPLAVIYSAGENLADGVAREERQVSRYGDLIKNEGKKLSAMVEQILQFAGANSGKMKYDFRAQSVASIIENALDECRALIQRQGFAVETDIAENLPRVKADAQALSGAIQNLIGNSLKYSNGTKWLRISAHNGGGKVKITVEDKGIGIAPGDLKHIFEPFYRAKAVVDEQIHGNGLGLSLVKETVRAHGGKITAHSEVGKGSRFTIELPRKEN
jgi:signal transduction histidine kinase